MYANLAQTVGPRWRVDARAACTAGCLLAVVDKLTVLAKETRSTRTSEIIIDSKARAAVLAGRS
jgi:hypothetical protein